MKIDKKSYESVMNSLNGLRNEDGEKYGVFFLGTQIFMGKTRVYATYNTAKARVKYEFEHYRYLDAPKNVDAIINKLLENGFLEIRKISDRSPRFPYNKTENKETADNLCAMLDSSDKEMMQLGLLIIEANEKEKVL